MVWDSIAYETVWSRLGNETGFSLGDASWRTPSSDGVDIWFSYQSGGLGSAASVRWGSYPEVCSVIFFAKSREIRGRIQSLKCRGRKSLLSLRRISICFDDVRSKECTEKGKSAKVSFSEKKKCFGVERILVVPSARFYDHNVNWEGALRGRRAKAGRARNFCMHANNAFESKTVESTLSKNTMSFEH